MTKQAVAALESDYEAILALAATFTPEEWQAASSCAGWRVQDVIAHLLSVFQQLVDRGSMPEAPPDEPLESLQERFVGDLRHLTAAEVLERYRTLGEQAITALAGLQDVDAEVPLPGLGTYPLHLLANTYAFDHYTHLRVDLLQPFGPLDRPVPEAGAEQLGAVMDWMLAALPQMNGDDLRPLQGTVNLVLEGPGGRTVHVRSDGTSVEILDGTADDAAATVSTSTADFVRWGTRRAPWQGAASIEGDETLGAAFCDAAHIF
jgi:uncharacterized protein (TIGR03083 family)